jgi:coenzyme PQQ precursor peptide PqqA
MGKESWQSGRRRIRSGASRAGAAWLGKTRQQSFNGLSFRTGAKRATLNSYWCASEKILAPMEDAMRWETPIICEVCVGMEVTSYESADLPTGTDSVD